ncbi:MAG: hypothetical protein NC200_07650 [Candidatus Gastranaerophilales bacterium]|nr:hypothetical protein [Candidatus Gastranaerophilales bacterium]
MVSAISSINQTPVNREVLEVIRRLQSLGVRPTGNLSVDRQLLQQAELQKKQTTLATNSEQNLNSIQGTNKDFSSTLNNIGGQPQTIEGTQTTQEIGLIKVTDTNNSSSFGLQIPENEQAKTDIGYKMIGATQLAELNKLKLGLIA